MNYQFPTNVLVGMTFILLFPLFGFLDGQEKSKITNSQKASRDRPSIMVVQGAGGSNEYQAIFRQTCQKIETASRKAGGEFTWIGAPKGSAPNSDSEKAISDLEKTKQAIQQHKTGTGQFWLILVGHGTFDRKAAKFNLRGPDLSAKQLNLWLEGMQRPVAVVNCASCSAPFINELAANDRVVVSATQSGFELNYARFGIHFADALSNSLADIDKDDQVSLLESFLFASRKVEEYYKSESRLATEHALIDDNGDGKGTPLEFFRGVRVIKKSADESIPDGPVANQIHLIQSEFE
ncbi:MAG: hypothetical protein VX438_13395, partial [Planctomycetota bacterium]|nr:hypothetical protein [Planctomycetota bacterium]